MGGAFDIDLQPQIFSSKYFFTIKCHFLMPMLKISGAIPVLLLYVFVACSKNSLNCYL
jgi:hypothetical protein